MLILISPAKTLDFNPQDVVHDFTLPQFIDESEIIVEKLKKLKPAKLAKLMNISPKLAQLNYERYQEWQLPFTHENAKQAILAFKGDVYTGLDADTFNKDDFAVAQKQLRILSGLHGILKPLDLMQPYRLEMGTSISVKRKKDLYHFWKIILSDHLIEEIRLTQSKYLINLASNEYFKVIDTKKINIDIITPVFKEFKNGQYKFMSFFGKKARGLMARYIIKHKISDPEQMKLFDSEGYYYNDILSNGNEWVFTRG
jgi:hypothetical protein